MRFASILGLVLFAPLALAADRAAEIARIHAEVIGGKERIAALKSLRATGHVIAAGKQVRFSMIAERPAKVRLETEDGGRTLVQASDGTEPPWEFDTGTWPPKYRPMAEHVVRTFTTDAEFDDPLVAGSARGYTLEYAGEIKVENRKLHRILVTWKLQQTFSVLVDDETFLIGMRVERRPMASGRQVQVVTHYDDFRPVDGVLLPHVITVTVDGKATQQTKISRIEANPKIEPSAFTRPKVAVPGIQKG